MIVENMRNKKLKWGQWPCLWLKIWVQC